jgi:hypothetical protein
MFTSSKVKPPEHEDEPNGSSNGCHGFYGVPSDLSYKLVSGPLTLTAMANEDISQRGFGYYSTT